MTGPNEKDLLDATLKMFPRLGATAIEIRYSEPDKAPVTHGDAATVEDAEKASPVVWMAIAHFTGTQPQVAAALSPGDAGYRLLEQLVDGGQCTHCKHATGITIDVNEMPAAGLVCWWQFDPELVVFRRGCS